MSKRVPHVMHGLSGHRLYDTFVEMHNRCYNPSKSQYKDWGGRGIAVCDRWNKNLIGTEKALNNFIVDMYPSFKEGLTLDRINNDLDYSPDNCKWSTKQEQSENARSVRPVLQINRETKEVIAEFKTLHEAHKVTGIPWQGIRCCCHKKPKYKTAGGCCWKFKEREAI
jgi:hypothetical protein